MEEVSITESKQKNNGFLKLVIGLILLAALGGGAYYYQQSQNVDGEANTEMGEAVAKVNGVEVERRDYEQSLEELTAAFSQQGLDVADPAVKAQMEEQALRGAVNKELLLQAAAKENVTVNDEDVEGEYQKVVASVGGVEVLAVALNSMGRNEAELREDLRGQLIIDRFVKAKTKYEELSVSDEEIETYYNEVSAENTDEVPPLEEVKEALRSQLLFQKQQQVVGEFIDSIRATAKIEIIFKGSN